MKIFQMAGLALLAGTMAFSAAAQEPPAACPADAEAQAYQASKGLEWVIQQEDLNREAGVAINLADACPDRPFVQYFSARSFFFILRKIGDPAGQFQYLAAATNALRAYDATAPEDRVWKPGLTAEDGSDISVDTISAAKSMLAVDLVPLVVRFEAGGMFHEFVSYEGHKPGNPCPWKTAELAVAEAAGYPDGFDQIDEFFYQNGQIPNTKGATDRIEFLRTACPAAKKGLTVNLAKIYAQGARGADGIGDAEGASGYAKLAIAEYEAYLPLATADNAAPSMIAATNRVLKEMNDLVIDEGTE